MAFWEARVVEVTEKDESDGKLQVDLIDDELRDGRGSDGGWWFPLAAFGIKRRIR